MNPYSSTFIRYQYILDASPVLFSDFWNILRLKRGDLISSGEPLLQSGWIILSLHLYLSFKTIKDASSCSFIRFDSILHVSTILLSYFWNFFRWKSGNLISRVKSILQDNWIIRFPHLHFSFKNAKDQDSFAFVRFDSIIYDSAILFWDVYNLIK